tara:strand:+ start:1752 stop:1979 length:228 start_codon:yes stop_codon:yes gene_type:complete
MNIETIEQALRLHINYVGKPSNGRYLEILDNEAYQYTGARGIKISKLLDNYFKQVNVENLTGALDRLRKIDNIIY